MINKGCYVTLRPDMDSVNTAMMIAYLGEGPYLVIDFEKMEVEVTPVENTILHLTKIATDYGDYRKVPTGCFVRTEQTKELVDWKQEGF